jgi:leucyl-tRNA synthetase
MHEGVVRHWVECLAIIICPICPHWSETLWKDLGKDGLAVRAPWPTVDEEDKLLSRQAKFLRDALKNFRNSAGKAKKGWKEATILVADEYPQWKVDALLWMQSQYDAASGSFLPTFMNDLKTWSATSVPDKKQVKFVMQFCGETGMDTKCPFDQMGILNESTAYIKSQLNLEEVSVVLIDGCDLEVPDKVAQNVSPGKPTLWLR